MTQTKANKSMRLLWRSTDQRAWEQAENRYWDFLKPDHVDLEHRMEALTLKRLRQMDAAEWYTFLRDDYLKWKYTANNRRATVSRQLKKYVDTGTLNVLDGIRERLLALDPTDIWLGLLIADQIKGLGPAGASGLLALFYPQTFGTVDQFAVKALRDVTGLPEAAAIARMKPESLSVDDGVVLIGVMQRKATELNQTFATNTWTPRRIDKIVWQFAR
ncbi:MAG: hypothetical protein ACRERC_17010 [Candidatus Binatia bacterium]